MLKPEAPGLDPGALFAPFAGEKRIGLAVSGGPDSLALMLLAQRWAQTLTEPPALTVYTLDHGLRPEAEDETRQVARLARDLDLKCHILRWCEAKPSSGQQAAARWARYRIIGDAMRKDDVGLLLTAHHADDQAETVLMRLAHGSGIDGLAGMAGVSKIAGVRVGRPLLHVAKRDLESLVRGVGLRPADDPSNRDPAYERARWRSLQPALDEMGLDSATLTRLARRSGEVSEALNHALDRISKDTLERDGFGIAHLDRGELQSLPFALRTRLLSRSVALATGVIPRDLEGLERLAGQVAARDFAGCTWSGARIAPYRDALLVHAERGRKPLESVALDVGESRTWDRRFVIEALDDVLTVRPFDRTRMVAEKLFGRALDLPMAALRGTPLVLSQDSSVLAVGTHVFDPTSVRVKFGKPS